MGINDRLHDLIARNAFGSGADLGRHGTVLGMLYDAYTELNNTETGDVQQAFKTLYELLSHVYGEDTEKIANAICDLCREHEKAGFINGIQLGIRLAQEANIQ